MNGAQMTISDDRLKEYVEHKCFSPAGDAPFDFPQPCVVCQNNPDCIVMASALLAARKRVADIKEITDKIQSVCMVGLQPHITGELEQNMRWMIGELNPLFNEKLYPLLGEQK